ncbi:MAG: nucleotidyltransferase family protein [Sphingomonadales bacterium]|nr:nucleotidyltransferase family protein [Sphingomonadales bacterium]MBD3774497.1 nucleotidyltransferase family protein [Paracoccaceae bacterium]
MPTPHHSRWRRGLLALLGHRWSEGAYLDNLGDDDWRAMNRLAASHRVQPHLHARLARGELSVDLPDEVRDAWAVAYRESALVALRQRHDLVAALGVLRRGGIEPLALKGACLAWHAYPDPAERPMRDIDLLVERERLFDAYRLLRAAHYRPDPTEPEPDPATFAQAKHLPPIISANNTAFELHHTAWEPPGSMEWFVPPSHDARLRSNAVASPGDSPIHCPRAQDMLAHLVVHAVYSHRLDAGPLLLPDIDYLLQGAEIDWPDLWQAAQAEGWARGAAIVIALVDYWRRPGLLEQSGCPIAVPPAMLRDGEDLLVQSIDLRKGAALVGSLGAGWHEGGLPGLASRAVGRLSGQRRPVAPHGAEEGERESYLSWLARRVGETLEELRTGEAQATARRASELGDWLDPARSGSGRG